MATRKRAGLGDRLRTARLQAGLSQTKLAERSGIQKPTLSRYENGHVLPSIPSLQRLARSLGVDLSELLSVPDRDEQLITRVLRERGIYARSLAEANRIADVIVEIQLSDRG